MSEERDVLIEALDVLYQDMNNPERVEYLKKMYDETAKGNAVGKFDQGFEQHKGRIQMLIKSIEEKREIDTPQKRGIICEAIWTLESQILRSGRLLRMADPNANTSRLDSKLKTIDDLRNKYCKEPRNIADDVVEKITGES